MLRPALVKRSRDDYSRNFPIENAVSVLLSGLPALQFAQWFTSQISPMSVVVIFILSVCHVQDISQLGHPLLILTLPQTYSNPLHPESPRGNNAGNLCLSVETLANVVFFPSLLSSYEFGR